MKILLKVSVNSLCEDLVEILVKWCHTGLCMIFYRFL